MLKSLTLLNILFVLLFNVNAYDKVTKPEIKVGYINYPPFFIGEEPIENYKPFSGLLNIKITELLKDYQIKWVYVPLPRGIDMLNSGAIDIYTPLVYEKERAKLIDFVDTSLATLAPHTCSFNPEFKDVKDDYRQILKGKKLIFPIGNLLAKSFLEIPNLELVNISYSTNYISRSLDLLLQNRGDAALFPTIAGVKDHPKARGLYCIQTGKARELTFSLKKGNPLRLELNKILAR